MLKSPLNYVGNKSKLIPQLLECFPKDTRHFVDVFCGSGVVGLNASREFLTLNDNNKPLFTLLQYLKNTKIQHILQQIQTIIECFNLTDSKSKPKDFYTIYKNEGLSRYNKAPYTALRHSYNQNPTPLALFVLILYGFNHFLRFNAKGEFNVPVGKGDFSHAQVEKTIAFCNALQSKNITLSSLDFRDDRLYTRGDFFYFDPPYLITNAPYNAAWGEKDELALYERLNNLHKKGLRFALSNVLLSNGKENELLKHFAQKYRTIELQRQYNTANYRRKNLSHTKEVLIINY